MSPSAPASVPGELDDVAARQGREMRRDIVRQRVRRQHVLRAEDEPRLANMQFGQVVVFAGLVRASPFAPFDLERAHVEREPVEIVDQGALAVHNLAALRPKRGIEVACMPDQVVDAADQRLRVIVNFTAVAIRPPSVRARPGAGRTRVGSVGTPTAADT